MTLISSARSVHFQAELTTKKHVKIHVCLYAFDERGEI